MKQTGKPYDILVVDDDSMLTLLAGQSLADKSYAISIASSGAEALLLSENSRFDLAVVDYRLPGQSGLDVAEVLQQRDIPFLMLTGSSDERVINRALELGALSYVVKPVTPRELEIAVATALKHAEDRRQLYRANRVRDIVGLGAGLTMAVLGLSREEALAVLRRRCRSRRQSLNKYCQELIRLYEANAPAGREAASQAIIATLDACVGK